MPSVKGLSEQSESEEPKDLMLLWTPKHPLHPAGQAMLSACLLGAGVLTCTLKLPGHWAPPPKRQEAPGEVSQFQLLVKPDSQLGNFHCSTWKNTQARPGVSEWPVDGE